MGLAPLTRTWTSNYNVLGQKTQVTDPLGQIIKFEYDANSRPWKITNNAGTPYITYGYDSANRKSTMADATGTTTWTYDNAGRVTQVAGPQGTIGYGYDNVDRRQSMTLPGSKTVTYGYDNAGQLQTVSDWQSRVTSFAYTGFGALDTIVRPNGVNSNYDYDPAGRLNVVEHTKGATLLTRYAYGLDAAGNRTANVMTGTALTPGTESYVYDELDRLTTVTYPNSGGSVTYEYDANGNRTKQTSGTQITQYSYDALDQLTSTSGAFVSSYTYDANGNRTGAGTDTFQYDWRNRMTQATVGGTSVTYEYAGDDLRVKRTQGSTVTPYLWDREAGLLELVDDGTQITVQLGGGELASINRSTNAATYPLADALGSARTRTDGAGLVTGTSEWDAWGNVRSSSGTQGSFGWTGELKDASTNLVYLRARDYSPGTGRFTSRDTVRPNGPATQGYNAYHYTANNPTSRVDPTGHDPEVAASWTALVAVTGALIGLTEVLVHVGKLPPTARGLVIAIVAMGMIMLRGIQLFLLQQWWTAMSVASKFVVGRAQMMIRFATMFNPMTVIMARCGMSGGRLCMGLERAIWWANNSCVQGSALEGGQAVASRDTSPAGLIQTGLGLVEACLHLPGGDDGYPAARGRGTGYPSFDRLKGAIGKAGAGKEWHHIVEQNPSNVAKFGAEKIHNTDNVIAVDAAINRQIGAYYSSKPPDVPTGGLTVRDWLKTKSFEEQYQFGLDVLHSIGGDE